jgi:uncharacterized membrane protein required for colicin V production
LRAASSAYSRRCVGPIPQDMWLDAIVLAVLVAFAAVGALRGALATGLGIVSLVASYAAALALAPILGPALAAGAGIPEMLAIPIAGTGAFLATVALMGVVSKLVRLRARRRDGVRSPRDRFLGGVFGAARGGLVVLLLCWLALWADALRATGTVESLPAIDDSLAAAVTAEVVESGLEAALSDQGRSGRVAARMAARPGVALVEVQSVLEDSRIAELRADPLFWRYVESANVDAALNRMSFLKLMRDDALRRRLADLGMVDEDAALDSRAFRRQVGEVLAEVGPRIRGLRDDPQVRALVEDPQVVAMLQEGDTLSLLGHPGFRDLVGRVTSSTPRD